MKKKDPEMVRLNKLSCKYFMWEKVNAVLLSVGVGSGVTASNWYLLILVMCHSDKFIMETLKHYKWLHTSIENVALIRLNCKVLL